MSAYWMEHAKSTTVESMMLDDNAASITASDMEEVLAMLPPYEGDDVCEVRPGVYTLPRPALPPLRPPPRMSPPRM